MLTATAAAASATVQGQPPCANRFFGLLTLRRLFQPILSSRRKRGRTTKSKRNANKTNKWFSSDRVTEIEAHVDNEIQTSNQKSTKEIFDRTLSTSNECPLCIEPLTSSCLADQLSCLHRVCDRCLLRYLCVEIDESRINLKCPCCDQELHPNLIYETLRKHENSVAYIRKYEQFMLRRVLITEQDARWCPAPDCNYIVIASGCASCPSLECARPECRTTFCYHCKQQWHPDQTCDTARVQRRKHADFHLSSGPIPDSLNSAAFRLGNLSSRIGSTIDASSSSTAFLSSKQSESGEPKPCPNCGVFIIKMNDGSCNHITCTVCSTEFCWLCLKRISDLHYLSPSGCTFWGKKPWSRKKKIFWQIGMLIGAPVGIALIAGIAVPTIVVGIPVWFGRKLSARLVSQSVGPRKRVLLVTSGVISSILVSPFVAAIVVGIGVPVMLTYVYGVVPLSLVRSERCGLNTSGVSIEANENHVTTITHRFDDFRVPSSSKTPDNLSLGAVSEAKSTTNASIGEFSMSPSHGAADELSQSGQLDTASTIGMMGSRISSDQKSSS